MFTPVETSIGALLLHQATSNLLYQNGGILGLSGLLRRLMTAPTVEVLALFAGMAASYPLLGALVPEVVTRYPLMAMTPQTVLFTAGVAALIGWGTKVSGLVDAERGPETDELRHRMAAHPDICSVVFHDSADDLR